MTDETLPTKRYHSFRLEAIVLRHSDWGEADRLIWLFSLEMGKLRGVAKGVRKPRSRKAGHLEPFTRVNLLLAHGRDLPIITQAETINAYIPLRDDLLRATYAAYVVELLDRFTYEEGEQRGVYHLLVETLERLCQPIDANLALRYYEMRLLDFMGFRPHLFNCANCQVTIQPQDQFFSAQQGGVLCPRCGQQFSEAKPVSTRALKYLRHFQRSGFNEARRASLTPAINHEIETLVQYYITFVLERGLNTPPFIKRARREAE